MQTLSTKTITILIVGLLFPISAEAAGVFVSVDANPSSIPADGTSLSRVVVRVMGADGAPVSDNTEVRLTASAGDITPVAYTSGGEAVGILTSSECPQIAIVSATASGASATVQVEFSSSLTYEEVTASSKTIRMEGGSLAYCLEKDVVLASGGVSIEYKNLKIEAAGAQVCQSTQQMFAQGNVSVQKDDKTLQADALICSISKDHIVLIGTGDESATVTYDAKTLTKITSNNANADDHGFVPVMDADGKNWIVSSRLTLIPGEKILFFKASIYVGDVEVLKVPYYSYNYKKRESVLHQVRYSSEDGMLVDLPFYYQVSDSSTGALKLRYAADGSETGGYTRPRKGLSIGLDQDYSTGDSGHGRVFIDSVGSSSQAIEMAHHLEFGAVATGGRADVTARYQPSSSYAKNILSTTLNVAGNLNDYSYSIAGYLGSSSIQQYIDAETVDYVGQSNCSLRTVFRPRTQMMSGLLGRISPSLTFGYGTLWTSNTATSSSLYQSLGMNFKRSLSSNHSVTTDFEGTTSFTLTAAGKTGTNLRAGPSLRRSWRGGRASVGYTLNLQGGTTDSVSANAVHKLTTGLFMRGSEWTLNSSASYGLDSGRLSLASSLNYRAARNWRLRLNYNLYSYSYTINDQSYRYGNSYLKVGVYRPLGAYEIGLAWSPNGRDYGADKSKRVWLELGGKGY